jgi:hypothetical protein
MITAETILAAPFTGETITTGDKVGVVYYAKFQETGFWGLPSFDIAGKLAHIEDRAQDLFWTLQNKRIQAKDQVEASIAAGFEPSEDAVTWSKLKVLSVEPELSPDLKGATFAVVLEVTHNNPLIVAGVFVLLLALVGSLIVDDVAHADANVEASIKLEGLEPLHDFLKAMGDPAAAGSPADKIASALSNLALAAMLIGGLLLLPRVLR